MFFSKKIKSIISFLLPGLFLILLLNTSLNLHNHKVAGFLYSHSHPFSNPTGENQADGSAHGHSLIDLLLLDLVCDQDFLELSLTVLVFGMLGLLTLSSLRASFRFQQKSLVNIIPRAPPV